MQSSTLRAAEKYADVASRSYVAMQCETPDIIAKKCMRPANERKAFPSARCFTSVASEHPDLSIGVKVAEGWNTLRLNPTSEVDRITGDADAAC